MNYAMALMNHVDVLLGVVRNKHETMWQEIVLLIHNAVMSL